MALLKAATPLEKECQWEAQLMIVMATTAQPAMLVKKQLSSNMAVSLNKNFICILLDAR